MEDAEGLLLCHCMVLDYRKDGEDSLTKATNKCSDVISKLEKEPRTTWQVMLCHVCSQNPRKEDHVTTSREEALSLAYNERGQLKYLLVSFDDAVQDYSKAIELYPNAISFYNRGQVYYRLGNFTEAVEDFEEALKHQPNFESARMGLEASKQELEGVYST